MSVAGISEAQPAQPLPALRSDLVLELVAERGQDFPSVVVTDPVRGCYLRLAWPESGIFLHWSEAASVEDLRSALAQRYGAAIECDKISAVVEFAFANQLTEVDQSGGWQKLAAIRAAGRHGWLKTLVHSYLFFRVPLFHPELRLRAALPRLSFVFGWTFWGAVLVAALVAGYLASRQWADVVVAAQNAFRLQGLPLYAVAVLALKAVHEFGHALTCVYYGCRVPTVGIAVMLGAPVLYTDTSDSWRLSKRRERLAIVFAGVAAELIVATAALMLWVFLPDGVMRELCFAFATTSVALSLAVNLNPFMRFDGYFALSDYLEIPNLQSRSFALLAWKGRELLFGLGHAPPERLPPHRQKTLIAYAAITAVYRLFLYLGIAAVVYAMAGKLIGIGLALFEVVVFIVRPIYDEIATWVKLRAEIIRSRRSYWTAGVAAGAVAVFVVPWVAVVDAPAVLLAAREEAIYLPVPGRLEQILVRDGQTVRTGELLFKANTPDLDHQLRKASLEVRTLELQVNRLHASDKERDGRIIIETKLARAREKVEALTRQRDQFELRAPHDGIIADLDPDISPGLWLNHKRPLARVVAPSGQRGIGMVAGNDIERLRIGALGVFVSDDGAARRVKLRLASITPSADLRLAEPALSERFGGPIGTVEERGDLLTKQAWFALEFTGIETLQADALQRGVIQVTADRVSLAGLTWRQVMRVVVREHGF